MDDNFIFKISNIMFIVILIVAVLIFVFVILSLFFPRFRAKMLSRNVKSLKYMTDYTKDDISDIANNTIESAHRIYKNNEETLRNINNMKASIKKDAIEATVRSIKKGIVDDDKIYCKHCGEAIDKDSTFCKACGKKL